MKGGINGRHGRSLTPTLSRFASEGDDVSRRGLYIKRTLVTAVLALGLAAPVFAGEAAPNAEDPVIEQRMNRLAEDLRCLVCQNESLAGSHAELAEDLRREIRDQMKQGKNDAEVIDYLTSRYGDFVLYKPPFKPVTWLLWLGPVLFLGIGGGVWYVTLKRRRGIQAPSADTAAMREAAQLLEAGEQKDKNAI